MQPDRSELSNQLILGFYKISYKQNLTGRTRYGQNYYDFADGEMIFIAPNRVISIVNDAYVNAGFSLYIHADFIRHYRLRERMKDFGFFSYATNEALRLSENEKRIILSIFDNMEQELSSTIDDFSQDVMVTYLELLLNYSNRFYKRQFITRKAVSNDLLEKLETLLTNYFNEDSGLIKGLPTVQYLAEQVAVPQRFLSDMLRSLTGQNTQQYIHDKLIEKAKERLSISNMSVAEIAYQLGFEHPQSFHKLFKSKTNISPLAFRKSFN